MRLALAAALVVGVLPTDPRPAPDDIDRRAGQVEAQVIAWRRDIHQHPELFTVLRSQAERALERVAVGLRPADQVKRYLLARPAARIPDISTAARDLGLSVRSLRRRLAADATSYRSLVQATLEVSAGHLLRDPQRSIQETAGALGFANVGAFHRAFRRWTGMTPVQYRERRGGGGGSPERGA